MAKDLEKALVNPEVKLGGEEKPHMDLGGHLEYIESLLEQGAGGAGGGKSVLPTLNLFDLSDNTLAVRTTITEEEKTNLENGLYNQVLFPGSIPDEFQVFMPSKLVGDKSLDVNTFVQFNCVMGDTPTINALSFYKYSFGAKDTSGNYPITITKQFDMSIGGSGGGGQIIDLNEYMDPNNNTITQSGYDLIQQAYENNTLLGISFDMFDTIKAVCMFDYVSLDIETMTNTYCFKFEAGETIIFKIKSDLTIVQSAQSSIAVYSQFTDLWYEGDYVSAIMSNETIYKIPYTLIYSRKDEYQNERLQFKNDTYDKTIYNIPTLPNDASSKNYALNSVNGALTWNTIGNGLEIKDGALKTTIPPLPADAASKTYTLKAVNGVLTWVEG